TRQQDFYDQYSSSYNDSHYWHGNNSNSYDFYGSTSVKIPQFQHPSHILLQHNGFTQQVYLKYRQECLGGQLYGLEKFWVFLKYSRQKPKINSKLEEILKYYKNREDFRVDGASFPRQFFPTKSRIITVPAPEAITAAAAKNSETSNSLKISGEHFP
ncbi:unnamed protein product, partial [Rotaria sordida]